MQGLTLEFWIFNTCVCLASVGAVRVACGSRAMELELEKSHFPGLHGQDLTMRDGGCGATDTPTHLRVTVPLDGCGTQVKKIGETFVYENQVLSHTVPVKGLVTRVRNVNVTVRCYYSSNITARNFYVVDTGELHFTDHSQGAYQISTDLVHNGDTYHPGNAVEPGDNLSIKLSLDNNDSHLQVFTKSCKATPTDETDHPEQYHILENGCATESALTFKDVSKMTQETLTFETFNFVNNSNMVYFHCEVLVCDVSDPESRCHHGCLTPGRGRRDAGGRFRRSSDRKSLRADVSVASHHLTLGPVEMPGASKRTKHSENHDHKVSNPETVRAAMTAGLALLGVVLIMITVALSIVVKSDDEDMEIKDEACEKLLDGDD
ncbi:ZP domain-containing protein-like [Haliotis rubra]|uniref:ZP domain-containing protein-like n=1 Tax=Haliotis rubra TaxID=36100 RepID=UPI001EE61C79|nr:ZP domain-containing protein-like [Haliotis rubra]